MPEYRYRAMTDAGKIQNGKLHVANPMELNHRLTKLKLDLISYKELKLSRFGSFQRRMSRKELINIVFQLEQLSRAGVPLLEGLGDIREGSDSAYVRQLLSGVIESIQGGEKFSEALSKYPGDFDTVFVALIKVGEETGELSEILRKMGDTLRWADELISKAKKIMIYPSIVAAVVFSVTAFLMVYLVPQIIPFIAEMGGTVPAHTKALIYTSEFFIKYWWAIIFVPFALMFFVKRAAKVSDKFRYQYDKFKMRIPLFGPLSLKIRLARFASYLALLYASGVTFMRALEICESLVDNLVLSEAICDIRQKISEGSSISEAFEQMQTFPALVVRMMRVGENTGDLDSSLLNVSYFYNREIQETIDKIEPAITPILTVVMGVTLGWIMLSVLGPIWDTVANI